MSATDWESLRLEFIHGRMSAEELAAAHGLKGSTVRKYAQRHNWREQREELSRRVAETAERVAQRAEDVAVEQRATTLAEFNADDVRLAKALRAEVARILNKSREAGGARLSPRDLNALVGAHEKAQRIGRLALGVSTDNLGHGGENGQGPVPVASVPVEVYLAAREQALKDF